MSCFDRDLTGSGSDDAIDESGHRLCQIGACLIISLMFDHMSEDFLEIDLVLHHDSWDSVDDELIVCSEMCIKSESYEYLSPSRWIGCLWESDGERMEHRLRRPHAFMDLNAKLLECYPLGESVLVDVSEAISILDDDIHISELAQYLVVWNFGILGVWLLGALVERIGFFMVAEQSSRRM